MQLSIRSENRFGSSLNAYPRFHGVVIDGVFDAATTGGVVFHAATGIDADAIAADAPLPSAPAFTFDPRLRW